MAAHALTKPFTWFYHEFGLAAIQATGRNAYLIILARSMRMVSFGMTQVILGKPIMNLITKERCG